MLAEHVNHTERAAFVAQVEADAAPFGDDPAALRAVGMAQALFGDLDKADVALDRLLALRPDDVDGNWLKGVRWVMAGWKDPAQRMADFTLARGFLAQTLKGDPNHYSALWLYGLTAWPGAASIQPQTGVRIADWPGIGDVFRNGTL